MSTNDQALYQALVDAIAFCDLDLTGDPSRTLLEEADLLAFADGGWHLTVKGNRWLMHGAPTEKDAVTVVLRFKDEATKRTFMSGLSDGFGEAYCDLEWPWRDGMAFDDTTVFDVAVPDEELE